MATGRTFHYTPQFSHKRRQSVHQERIIKLPAYSIVRRRDSFSYRVSTDEKSRLWHLGPEKHDILLDSTGCLQKNIK